MIVFCLDSAADQMSHRTCSPWFKFGRARGLAGAMLLAHMITFANRLTAYKVAMAECNR